MPELPEVETIKRALEKAVGKSHIKAAHVYCNKFRTPTPDDFAKNIVQRQMVEIKRIAKYLVIELDGDSSIVWHLGMSGKVKVFDKVPEALEKHDHVVIETSKGVLVYNDARRFGLITLVKTAELFSHPLFKNMGLEPFDEQLSGKWLKDRLKGKATPIKVALLDQSLVVGIGNIYASEALFCARIDPRREAGSLSLKECQRLVEEIIKTLEKAIEAGGSTLRDYQKPDGSMGYFQNAHCVYNKEGQRCPDCKCETKKTKGIVKIVQAGRSTFFCPVLQK